MNLILKNLEINNLLPMNSILDYQRVEAYLEKNEKKFFTFTLKNLKSKHT